MTPSQAPPAGAAATLAAERIARVTAKLEKPGSPSAAFGTLIYGRTKSGKTSLLATMPGRGLVIDVRRKEGGTNVLAPWADRIDVYPIHQWRELDDVVEYMKAPPVKYVWVALDTITGLLALAEETVVGRMQTMSSIPRQLKGNEWGTMGARIIRLLDWLHEMNIYSIVLAQEKRREVPDLGNVCVPDVIPMLLTPLTEPMAIIGHLRVANVGDAATPIMEHQIRVKAHPSYYTGMRVDPELAAKLPDLTRDCDLTKLIRFYLRRSDAIPEPATVPIASGGLQFTDETTSETVPE